MALNEYKLGELLEQQDERNSGLRYTLDDVKGISIQKCFIETKADMDGVSLKPYKLVKPDSFSYVTVTSRNGEKITLAHNTTENTYLVSSSYVVFRIKNPDLVISDYLFMYFNRPEFDRFSRFNSWGSARETFDWKTLCDIIIELPSIEVQRKYVAVYNAMVENQKAYEKGLEDLKLTCDGYIEELSKDTPCEKIGSYIALSDLKNSDEVYSISDVKGVSINKTLIETKADMADVNLKPYLLIKPNYFAYVTVTSRNGEKISLAINDTENTYICSSSYLVFYCKNESKLFPHYLRILLGRDEFNRYARFHSWGSARETFDWSEMCSVEIPIPDIKVQRAIAELFTAYTMRKEINEQLKAQIKDICPVLIKGSIEEARA